MDNRAEQHRQQEQQKQQIVSVFNTVAAGYDNPAMRFFAIAADRLVDTLKPGSNQKILDIATGTGAVATSCAQRLLPDGRVVAIDMSEAMMEKAMQKASQQGLGNIDFFTMDADDLAFDNDYFDHALCSFGIFFLPDMKRGLEEWLRVVKPGGSVMFSSFAEQAFKPMVEVLVDELQEHGVEFDESPLRSQKLTTIDQCTDLMNLAGLSDCKVEQHQLGYHLQSVDDWWSIVCYSGLRGWLDRLDNQQKPTFKDRHLASIESLFTEKGLWLDVGVLISQGKVPQAK